MISDIQKQLESAFLKAHNAGNKEDAKILADEIRSIGNNDRPRYDPIIRAQELLVRPTAQPEAEPVIQSKPEPATTQPLEKEPKIDSVTTEGIDLNEKPIETTHITPTDSGKVEATPDGIYNNPGNLERSSDNWYGMIKDKGYGENNRFIAFDTKENGVRALMKDLRTKIDRHDGDLTKIVNQYAPKNENKVEDYISNVHKIIGKKDKYSEEDIKDLAKAFIIVENKPNMRGYYLDDPSVLDRAYESSLKDL